MTKSLLLALLVGLSVSLKSGLSVAAPLLFIGSQKMESRVSRTVFVENGEHSLLSYVSDYTGPHSNFGIVLAVPSTFVLKDLLFLPASLVDDITRVTAPRFVEYWQVPRCAQNIYDHARFTKSAEAASETTTSSGTNGVVTRAALESAKKAFEELELDETPYYDPAFGDREALMKWSKARDFPISSEAQRSLRRYATEGWQFLFMGVHIDQVDFFDDVSALLPPLGLRLTQRTSQLPLSFGSATSHEQHDAFVFSIAQERKIAAQSPTILAPTNGRVEAHVRTFMDELHQAVFLEFINNHPKGYLQEYAWSAAECAPPCPGKPLSAEQLGRLSIPHAPAEKEVGGKEWILSRLHARFRKSDERRDLTLIGAQAIQGGTNPPRGPDARTRSRVERGERNRFVTTYVHAHRFLRPEACAEPADITFVAEPPVAPPNDPPVFIAKDMSRKSARLLSLEEAVIDRPRYYFARSLEVAPPKGALATSLSFCSISGANAGDARTLLLLLVSLCLGARCLRRMQHHRVSITHARR